MKHVEVQRGHADAGAAMLLLFATLAATAALLFLICAAPGAQHVHF